MSTGGFVKHLSFLSSAHLLQSPLVNNHSLGELWLLMESSSIREKEGLTTAGLCSPCHPSQGQPVVNL